MNLTLPRAFGRYTLLKSLRRGAMGEAFLAAAGAGEDSGLCVVKVGLPDLPPDAAVRFADETRVLRRLSFSGIARLLDSGVVDGQRFIAMEYVEGCNLNEVMTFARAAKVAVPPAVAAYIVKEIARSLHYAHNLPDLSLIHRDVAPANVMIAVSGEVKLIDFGLARSSFRRGLTVPGSDPSLGHFAYMAPERIAGTYDQRSDLYSAGVILWELLTGTELFPWDPGDSRGGITADRANPPPPSRKQPGLDPELDGIVVKAIAANPSERFQSGDEFRATLATYLGRIAPDTDVTAVADFLRKVVGDALIERLHHDRSRFLPAQPGPAVVERPTAAGARVGQKLAGKYDLIRLCGTGGTGDVYEARHEGIRRRVAVKVLKPEYREHREVFERFVREARLAARANSEHIVQITDAGSTSGGCPYIVMEYVEGETLRQILDRERTLPLERALRLAVEVARALESAHEGGVVHRDLKPSNVMVVPEQGDRASVVKLLDFGISKAIGGPTDRALTRGLTPIGTPEYMAPEQTMGLPADFRADVYAVGGLLFEMLTGRTPFEGTSAEAIMERKQAAEAPRLMSLLPDVPVLVDEAVARALARTREGRQADMATLREELATALAAVVPAPTGQTIPMKRLRWRPLSPASVVMVALIAGGLTALSAVRTRSLVRRVEVLDAPKRRQAIGPRMVTSASTATAREAVSGTATDRATREAPMITENLIPKNASSRSRASRAHTERAFNTGPKVRPAERSTTAPIASSSRDWRALANAAAQAVASSAYIDAIELGEDAIAEGATGANVHVTLGTANLMLGRMRQAERHFRTAASFDPSNQQAQEGLAAALKNR